MRQRLESWADYFGGVGLALLVVTGIFYLLRQPTERLVVLGVLGVVCIALYMYARPQQVRQTVTSRGALFGSNLLLVTVAFIGLVGMLNWLSGRYNSHYDLTANKSNSLSELTVKVLQDLKEPVKATAFFVALRPPGDNADQEVKDRLKEYARYSDKFTYEVVDPQFDLQRANDYKAFDGMIVLERGKRRENALNSDEQTITNAILKVSQDQQPVVYFTTGHGERSVDDSGDNGYSLIKSGLETDNYRVATLNLKTVTGTLPSDLTALIVAGPRQKFDADEVQRVQDYLDKNGRLFIMIDPQTDTGLESLLKTWGLTFRNDILLDPRFALQGQLNIPIINAYKSHAVTKDLANFSSYFVNVRTLSADSPSPAGRFATALFSSSDASWGETDFAGLQNQKFNYDANVDAKGPLDLAYAVEASGGNTARLVVFGNSSFVTNVRLRLAQFANPLLFGNVIHWLAGQENLIAIPPKPTSSYPLVLNADQANFVFLSSFLFLPGAVLLIGAIIWWRRR